jgi:ribosomal protein S18 acetylase RimI-like enzyme
MILTNFRKVDKSTLAALQNICVTTFEATYGAFNTKSDMANYLQDNFSIQQLENDLANPSIHYVLIESEGNPIGYLKLNWGAAQTEKLLNNALEIERIYIVGKYQGQQIGEKLLQKAIAFADEKTKDTIWLGVWNKNPKAIRFYERNGFKKFDEHMFMLGEDEQIDLMMKMELNN